MITEQGNEQSCAGAEVLIGNRFGHTRTLGQMGQRQRFGALFPYDVQCGLHELTGAADPSPFAWKRQSARSLFSSPFGLDARQEPVYYH